MSEDVGKMDENMWKDNLEEWIYDETRIVTYKWLSKQLSVHVNVAKQMLFEFVQKNLETEKKSKLEVIYLLAGQIAQGSKCMKVCLVKSGDLASKEAEFDLLTSKHVYAISKAEDSLMKETNLSQVCTYVSI